jgi:hypothetical protein
MTGLQRSPFVQHVVPHAVVPVGHLGDATHDPALQTVPAEQHAVPQTCAVGQQVLSPRHISPSPQQASPHTEVPVPAPPQHLPDRQVAPGAQQESPHVVLGGLQQAPPAQIPGGGQQPVPAPPQNTSSLPQQNPSRHCGVVAGQQPAPPGTLTPRQSSPAPSAQQTASAVEVAGCLQTGWAPGQQTVPPQGWPSPLRQ